MDRNSVIDFGNKFLGHQISQQELITFIDDYLKDKVPKIAGEMFKAFMTFPDTAKYMAVQNALSFYVSKYNINTLVTIQQSPFGIEKTIIKYLER